MILQEKSTNTGLYCQSCGAWQKWLSKEEIRTAHFNNVPIHNGEIKRKKTKSKKASSKQIESLFKDSGPFEENNVKDANKEINSIRKNKTISINIEIPEEEAESMLNLIEILRESLKDNLN